MRVCACVSAAGDFLYVAVKGSICTLFRFLLFLIRSIFLFRRFAKRSEKIWLQLGHRNRALSRRRESWRKLFYARRSDEIWAYACTINACQVYRTRRKMRFSRLSSSYYHLTILFPRVRKSREFLNWPPVIQILITWIVSGWKIYAENVFSIINGSRNPRSKKRVF